MMHLITIPSLITKGREVQKIIHLGGKRLTVTESQLDLEVESITEVNSGICRVKQTGMQRDWQQNKHTHKETDRTE